LSLSEIFHSSSGGIQNITKHFAKFSTLSRMVKPSCRENLISIYIRDQPVILANELPSSRTQFRFGHHRSSFRLEAFSVSFQEIGGRHRPRNSGRSDD
jgi:hypothetical protein